MKLKRGLIFLVFIILLISLVSAQGGCCQEKSPGVYCQEDILEGSCSFGWTSTTCAETENCKSGCCISQDGLCSTNTGKYTCTQNNGIWEENALCEIDQCKKGCCQFGDEFSFTTNTQCQSKYENYEESPTWDPSITSEQACNLQNSLDEFGCCVTTDGCSFITGSECEQELGYLYQDTQTGYGYYEATSCASVQTQLENYEASCDCQDLGKSCTDQHEITNINTCGDEILTGSECNYPNEVCKDGSCISAACSSTFKYQVDKTITQDLQDSTNLEMLNTYKVYNHKGEFEDFNLGQKRENLDAWCVFEGPTGSFKDRVGTQHYVAQCIAGEEVWYTCGETREEYCAMFFDDDGKPHAECIPNNFIEYYSYPYQAGKWGNEETPDYSDYGIEWNVEPDYENRFPEFHGEINQPIQSVEQTEHIYGVTTVPLASKDYCPAASFTCDIGYADAKPKDGKQDEGWEAYTNTICLRSEFIATAMDYCSSRGDCGINVNILGKEGDPSQFEISYSQTEIAGKDVGLGLGYDCFNGGEDTIESLRIQGQDGYSAISSIEECTKATSNNIKRYYTPIIKQPQQTINEHFLNDQMIPPFFPLSRLYYYSAHPFTSNLDSLITNLGINYEEGYEANIDFFGLQDQIENLLINYIIDNPNKIGAELQTIENQECLGNLIPNSPSCAQEKFKISKEYNLFNQLKSIKPWVMNTRALRASSIAIAINQNPETLSHYLGNVEAGGTEWEKATEDGRDMATARATYTCSAWQPPNNGDDCHLCDLSSEEGGLWFSIDGERIDGAQCTKTKCESLGRCAFIDGNRGSKTKPTCVAEVCEIGDTPELSPYTEITELTSEPYDIDIKIINGQYDRHEITNIPPGRQVSFGVKTENMVSRCKFVDVERIQEIIDEHEGVNTFDDLSIEYPDPDKLQDILSGSGIHETPLGGVISEDLTEPYDYLHNISDVFNNGEEKEYYIWCKNICGDYKLDHYELYLKASEQDPTTYSGTYVNFEPPTDSYAPATSETQPLYLYTDIPVTCKYSESLSDNFELIENEMDLCLSPSANIINGEYYCRDEIPITEGPNTFYFLCQDQFGNTMSTAQPYTITKTLPLLISQTSPEETSYESDILLQVRTQSGAEQGKSICYYKQSHQFTYDQMLNSYENGEHWTQPQTLGEGDYTYNFYCQDIAGNKNETTISFTMDIDEYSPEITRIYYLAPTISITTNEDTTCQYESSPFTFGSGLTMAGTATTQHTLTTTSEINNYYIICQDAYGNENPPFNVNLDYLL